MVLAWIVLKHSLTQLSLRPSPSVAAEERRHQLFLLTEIYNNDDDDVSVLSRLAE